jgi:hypothetical protein
MKPWLFRQKYRFDMGAQLMALINFALLVLAVGDKLGLPFHSWRLALLAIPAAFCSVWLLGLLLDKVGYAHAINTEIMNRNPPWDRQMASLHRIERALHSTESRIRAGLYIAPDSCPIRGFTPEPDPGSTCGNECGYCGRCT